MPRRLSMCWHQHCQLHRLHCHNWDLPVDVGKHAVNSCYFWRCHHLDPDVHFIQHYQHALPLGLPVCAHFDSDDQRYHRHCRALPASLHGLDQRSCLDHGFHHCVRYDLHHYRSHLLHRWRPVELPRRPAVCRRHLHQPGRRRDFNWNVPS